MDTIPLTRDDIFRVLRSMLVSELKQIRKNSNFTIDETLLQPDATLAGLFGENDSDSLVLLASTVLSFLDLDGSTSPHLLTERSTVGQWVDYLYDTWQPSGATIVFSTSGSTGEPKKIRMPYYVLVQDAKILVTLFPDTKRIISLAPPHHIFGFIYTILIPRLLGVQCLDLRTKTPRQTFREIEQGDTIIAVPHFWQMIAEISNSFPQSVCGVTSAAVCPGTVYRGIYHMGIKSFYDVYGSTENSMIGFRSDPEEPIMLSPAWTRIGDDHIVRTQPDGKFSTPSVLQDLLDWQDERHFYICKRIDSAVQVVGANVFPSRVAEHLLSHEAVAECAVRLMRPDEGNRLKAFVVLRNDYQASPEIEEPLQGYLALSLSAPEQPRTITFGRALPRNNMGKLTDWTDKRLAQKQETN